MQSLEDLLPLFKKYQKTSNGYLVTCPIHDDSSPSLHLAIGKDNTGKDRLLVHCFANCDSYQILEYINSNSKVSTGNGFVPASVNEDVKKTTTNFSTLVKTYNYRDENGKMAYQVLRYANPKSFRFRRPTNDETSSSGYIWSIGDTRRIMYNLDTISQSISTGQYIWKVEGEKDADILTEMGFTATCNLFGAGSGKWRLEYNEQLEGANLLCVPDEDESGYVHIYEVISSLISTSSCKSIKIVFLPVSYKGDMHDYISSGKSKDDLYKLIDSCTEVTSYTDDQLRALLSIGNTASGSLTCSKFKGQTEYTVLSASLSDGVSNLNKSVSRLEQTTLFTKAIEILEREGPYAGLCEKCLGTGFVVKSNGEILGILVEDGGSLLEEDEHSIIKLEKCMHGDPISSINFPF